MNGHAPWSCAGWFRYVVGYCAQSVSGFIR